MVLGVIYTVQNQLQSTYMLSHSDILIEYCKGPSGYHNGGGYYQYSARWLSGEVTRKCCHNLEGPRTPSLLKYILSKHLAFILLRSRMKFIGT